VVSAGFIAVPTGCGALSRNVERRMTMTPELPNHRQIVRRND
jgi:hypothetical protein